MTLTRGIPPKSLTSQEIARQTGVSRTTVSNVLSGRAEARVSSETRQRILEVARQAGYRRNHLARALISGRMYSVGIVTHADSLADPENTYNQRLFVHLTLAIRGVKMNAMTFFDPFIVDETSSEEGLRPSDLTDGRVDGVILVGHIPEPGWVHAVVRQNGIACVEISSSVGDASVQADHRGGTRAAVEHLLELGHRHFAYWTHPASTSVAKHERIEGFRETLGAAGITEHDAPVVDGASAFAALLRRGRNGSGQRRPTAVLTFNDAVAADALDVCRAEGLRVPEDLSLVGFDDDLRASVLRPRLTTVRMPVEEMAQTAVRLLLREIESRAETNEGVPNPTVGPHTTLVPNPTLRVLPTRLIIRESTAAVPPPAA